MVGPDTEDLGSKAWSVDLLPEHPKRQTLRSRPDRSSERGRTTTTDGRPPTGIAFVLLQSIFRGLRCAHAPDPTLAGSYGLRASERYPLMISILSLGMKGVMHSGFFNWNSPLEPSTRSRATFQNITIEPYCFGTLI